MAENREGFLRRWSRRKVETGSTAEPVGVEPAPVADPGSPPDKAEEEPFDVASLPDIETMHAGSDFKVFLQHGVPKELRNLALRKLWRVNPTLANLDGLVDYGADYSVAGNLVGKLKTAYQVGKGFVRDMEAAVPADEPAEPQIAADQPRPAARIGDAQEPEVVDGGPGDNGPEKQVTVETPRNKRS